MNNIFDGLESDDFRPTQWIKILPEDVCKFYRIPSHFAFDPSITFYAPNSLEMDTFSLVATILLKEKKQCIFRFWTLHEEFLHSDWDIFQGKGTGYIELNIEQVDSLIDILKPLATGLSGEDNGNLFTFIKKEIYEKYDYLNKWRNSSNVEHYIQESTLNSEYPVILTLIFNTYYQKIYIKTSQKPNSKVIVGGKEVEMPESNGELQMNKHELETFCSLIRKNFTNP
jgi:hypothetical protein